ncbi:MAG: NTP transferase domain-containing protein [Methyloprofundus sp.]|nr:NTP transferase domain-containing protein [Methyloprofundus sp.]
MKAMILAAGRGERMRPLTDTTPKPLLKANKKALIEYTVEALVKAGIVDIIINLAYLGKQIEAYLGDGSRYSANIQYTHEGKTGLETAGGIKNALPLLGKETFLVINADIYCDFPLHTIINKKIDLAHLILVKNPAHNPTGDFAIAANHHLNTVDTLKYTFSGIGLYRPELFANLNAGKYALAPLLKTAMTNQQITGELYEGFWMDIGTVDRLAALETSLINSAA